MTEKTILPEIKVTLTECKNGEKAVPLDYPENLGIKTKFGGLPDWIQDEEVPICQYCGKSMIFTAQIDSFEHYSNNNPNAKIYSEQNYMFGDVGMIYAFFCFECSNTQSIFQGY